MRTDGAMKRARLNEVRRRFDKLNGVPPTPGRKPLRKSARQPHNWVNPNKQFNENLLVIGALVLACICVGLAG